MKVGIIVAMDKEYAQLEKVFGREQNIVLAKCGIGKVNSALGAMDMIEREHPDLIISSGCAGGADTRLRPLDVVVARQCAYHDAYCGDNCEFGQIIGMPARYDAPKELVEKALALNDDPEITTKIRAGLTVSGEWFVDSKAKMQEILANFPDATAVDMESCSIAQTCYKAGVSFISFRVISDVPLLDTKASQYFDFWDRVAADSFMVTREFVENIIK